MSKLPKRIWVYISTACSSHLCIGILFNLNGAWLTCTGLAQFLRHSYTGWDQRPFVISTRLLFLTHSSLALFTSMFISLYILSLYTGHCLTELSPWMVSNLRSACNSHQATRSQQYSVQLPNERVKGLLTHICDVSAQRSLSVSKIHEASWSTHIHGRSPPYRLNQWFSFLSLYYSK